MKKKQSIGIFGCGWLGKPLADILSQEYDVACFSRETTVEESSFWQSDSIVIAIHTKEKYLKTLKKITLLAKPEARLIFMSSTSIYKEFDSDVDEDSVITSSSLFKEAEDIMHNAKQKTLILRLGGLMGEDRISGRWKKASSFSDGYVNYIHRDDVIAVIRRMLEQGKQEGTYNLVAPLHPLRSEIHQKNSRDFGFELGEFHGMTHRRVSSAKVVKELGYDFIYPNPLEFWS